MIDNCNADKYREPPALISSFLKLPSLREYYSQKAGSGDDHTNEGLAQLGARLPISKSDRADSTPRI